jgi:uncharacterized protein DUF1496
MSQKIYLCACVGLGLVVVCGALGSGRVEAGPGDRQSAVAQKVLGPPEPASSSEPVPLAVPGNPAPYLQAILGQLVVMNNELHRATDAEHARGHACSYADKAYTEGSLLKVEGVRLVCVRAVAGADQLGVGPEAAATADGEKRFVWEPLGSPRLARFRETEWQSPLVK